MTRDEEIATVAMCAAALLGGEHGSLNSAKPEIRNVWIQRAVTNARAIVEEARRQTREEGSQ